MSLAGREQHTRRFPGAAGSRGSGAYETTPSSRPVSQVWHTPVRHDHRTETSQASASSRMLADSLRHRTVRPDRTNETSGPVPGSPLRRMRRSAGLRDDTWGDRRHSAECLAVDARLGHAKIAEAGVDVVREPDRSADPELGVHRRAGRPDPLGTEVSALIELETRSGRRDQAGCTRSDSGHRAARRAAFGPPRQTHARSCCERRAATRCRVSSGCHAVRAEWRVGVLRRYPRSEERPDRHHRLG